ncbi:hypothetical protein F5I97DRAFT_1937892 [Phlebopus sp. FC_14]|nr:hypothetical protein F5I97DRAFT_1937892 [Phlebopus sp. FC_14]
MPAPERVSQWVTQNYPRPTVDPDWLADCCDWISSEQGLSPFSTFHQFIQHVESQLLQSNLEDSTVPGTGLDPQLLVDQGRAGNPGQRSRPGQRPRREKLTTGPIPLLVEVRSITEIAHSAFGLLSTHQTRLDRADLGLAPNTQNPEQDQAADEEDGPIPPFPRGMLRFELSDGSTTFRAVEHRSIPDLELGATPLGYKVRP